MDTAPPRKDVLTVPNLLSIGRIVATPVLVWLIVADRRVPAAALVAVMGITDFLDGYIARHTGTVSELGVLLDPVSDRIAVIATLVTMLWVGMIPAWLGGPVLARDILLSVVFLALARKGFGSPKVKFVGKAATFLLLTALPFLVLGGTDPADTDPFRAIGLVTFGVGGVLYYVAAVAYLQDLRSWLGGPDVRA